MEEFQEITEEDFFIMNQEFRIWLIKKKKKKFEDLETKKARKLFKKFAKKWNKKKLNDIFYKREKLLQKYGDLLHSSYNWSINLNQQDLNKLNECKVIIKEDSLSLPQKMQNNQPHNKQSQAINKNNSQQQQMLPPQRKVVGPIGPTRPPQSQKDDIESDEKQDGSSSSDEGQQARTLSKNNMSLNDLQYEREQQRDLAKQQIKYDRKVKRKEDEDLLDELVPKKVGKEAMIDKKRMLNQMINGSRDETGLEEYNEDVLFGEDSQSSFQRAKQRELSRQSKRQEQSEAKRVEMQQKLKDYEQEEARKLQDIIKGTAIKKYQQM